ncbi:MAG: DNA cytosine methyltransferase [Alphaproteobacteria bacterium]|nr:DNA cytosine methyltransferase [Alphaproteobacteria bacterium]MBL6939435.1 DNA cytosine methyltransferase [Alphaproteobacteria bacterium]MBL7097084.1 DNA cytosine methyltransferase [Alphaproteobacteria bacterium]
MTVHNPVTNIEIRHAHFFCGLGGGARGFNRGDARVGNLRARFRCLGGIDNDPGAIADFATLAGVAGTLLDLFDLDQYRAFHGKEPPPGWSQAGPDDVRRAFSFERPHIIFLSAPCKGFSGLLSENKSKTLKYQALNRLTLRGVWLALEAYKDDPVELFVFENVPRIGTRGRHFLDEIVQLFRAYDYAVAETVHDCGEIGDLAQSRKRLLLVARHTKKVPNFLYQPTKHRLRGVGEVLERLPMPGPWETPAGPMHRMPALQWKTWLRLALVEAGSDWRSLNRLAVENGQLRDYGIAPDGEWFNGAYGVGHWTDHANTVTSKNQPSSGANAVADPRISGRDRASTLGVREWNEHSGTVQGESFPTNGAFSIADARIDGHHKSVQLGVRGWSQSAPVIRRNMAPGAGPNAIADPRIVDRKPFNNIFRIVDWTKHYPAVAGPGGPASGVGVADPRSGPRDDGYKQTKYRVTAMDEATGAVIAASTTGTGAFAVADDRINDVRPRAFRDGKASYQTGGHYGVLDWNDISLAVSGHAKNNNGFNSVADPRAPGDDGAASAAARMPASSENLVCIIRALDNTWHRPLTTLELAALQGLVDPEEHLELFGLSDSAWRERIGNAVPPPSAQAIAGVMGKALLGAWTGQTFDLSNEAIWVQPIAIAVSLPGAIA